MIRFIYFLLHENGEKLFFVSPNLTAPYFLTAGVKKSRYTLAGALVATFAGVVASVVLVGWIM